MVEVRPPMSESDFTPKSQPLILRVEISAEQASTLAPLLGSALPATPMSLPPTAASVPDEVVDERLHELELREAEFEADVQLREDRMERWRTELEELEQTLERRERDLVSYVDQLQGAMANPGNDAAWWQRPAGGDGGVY
jgi:hypothetical protein